MYNPYERDWLQFRSCYCFSVLKAWSCVPGPLCWFLPAFQPRVIKLTPLLNGFLPVAFPWSQSVRETAPPSPNFPSWVEGSPRPLPDHHPIAFTSSCFEFTLLSFPSLLPWTQSPTSLASSLMTSETLPPHFLSLLPTSDDFLTPPTL